LKNLGWGVGEDTGIDTHGKKKYRGWVKRDIIRGKTYK